MKIQYSVLLLISCSFASLVQATMFEITNLSKSSDELKVEFGFSNDHLSRTVPVPLHGKSKYDSAPKANNSQLYILGLRYTVNDEPVVYNVDMKNLNIKTNVQQKVRIKVYDRGLVKIMINGGKEFGLTGVRSQHVEKWPTEPARRTD